MQKNFVGRTKERETLTNWLTADTPPMLSIVAIGGMGKTALAWYWLQEAVIGSEFQPKGFVWWSFYQKASFESFLDYAIEYASNGQIDAKGIKSTREKMDILYGLLSECKFLIVLDGFERLLRAYAGIGSTYQGNKVKEYERGAFRACIEPNCGMFLQWLASGYLRTKTLLTSRLYPKELDDLDGCLRMDLKRMDKEDAVEFFHRQSVKGTRAEIEMACESVGYHPLSLRLLSGMIVRDPENPGDIQEWRKYKLIPELKGKEGLNTLELAYNSLDNRKQQFISKLSAFRNPMDYDVVAIFNDFDSVEEFNEILMELVDRGMLFRDEKSNKFDLHPIVRRYCYDRLRDKKGVHSELRDYFAKIPEPEKIESLDDLAPVIELYHHTVSAGRYDEAWRLYYNRLAKPLLYKFGAYQTIIELLRALFPDSEYNLPRLKNESAQGYTLSALANSYSLSGRSRGAISLFEMSIEICKKQGDKENLAIVLCNLALDQMRIGELNAAEATLSRSIEICREITYEFWEAVDHRELGLLQIYFGKFEEAKEELSKSTKYNKETNHRQGICVDEAYRALRSLLMSNAEDALKYAEEARELADVEHYEIDFVQVEWLLGAAYLMKGNLVEAENHLTEALTRDRKINLVELEPDILLEFAKLRFKKNRKEEALKFADEALQIADRCEYRLKQADIHNFLAEFYLDAGELEKARVHTEIAKERAECGYKPALENAEKLLNAIELR